MNRLAGKVAIVTGAGRIGNIGVAVCDAFLREGATAVVATDLRHDDAEAITARMEQTHGKGRFLLLAHDVTDQLAAWRDELRVRAHLVGLDAKDAWKEIEPEVEKAESALRRLLDSTVPGGSELGARGVAGVVAASACLCPCSSA